MCQKCHLASRLSQQTRSAPCRKIRKHSSRPWCQTYLQGRRGLNGWPSGLLQQWHLEEASGEWSCSYWLHSLCVMCNMGCGIFNAKSPACMALSTPAGAVTDMPSAHPQDWPGSTCNAFTALAALILCSNPCCFGSSSQCHSACMSLSAWGLRA